MPLLYLILRRCLPVLIDMRELCASMPVCIDLRGRCVDPCLYWSQGGVCIPVYLSEGCVCFLVFTSFKEVCVYACTKILGQFTYTIFPNLREVYVNLSLLNLGDVCLLVFIDHILISFYLTFFICLWLHVCIFLTDLNILCSLPPTPL